MIQNHNQGLSRRRGLGFDLSPATFGRNCSSQTFGHSGSTGTLAWADPVSGLSFVLLTSLPARASKESILKPASDLVSTAQAV
jgi:CubicO group peptidase (beta-lactamase class C family)